MLFRFGRQKRFGAKVHCTDFLAKAQNLAKLVHENRPSATIEVLTYEETLCTSQYSGVLFSGDDASGNSKAVSYSLEQFESGLWEIWKRSLEVQLTIRDSQKADSFMVCMSFKTDAPSRLYFYGQCVGGDLFEKIYRELAHPDLFTKIVSNVDRQSLIGVLEHSPA